MICEETHGHSHSAPEKSNSSVFVGIALGVMTSLIFALVFALITSLRHA